MGRRFIIRVQAEDGAEAERRFIVDSSRARWMSLGVGLGVALLMGLMAAGGWSLRASMGNGPSAQAENVRLKSDLHKLDARLVQIDRSLDRVMAYDAKIRKLTQDDEGARGFGIGPLSSLEIAAAERERADVALPGEDLQLGPTRGDQLDVVLTDLDQRARQLETRTFQEEESLQEVRGYLDDRTSLLRAYPSVWPVRGWITSRFGYRNSPYGDGARRLHTGLDIAAPQGTPVIAPADGHVVFAGYHSAYGNLVVIDHGYGMTTKYAHTSRILVQVGERVRRGDLIARVGNTGRSTGPHLHFEVLKEGVPVNPMRYLSQE